MKKIIITLICIISIYPLLAQKYTETYINDANKIGLRWLNYINHHQYETAYDFLAAEAKQMYPKQTWIKLIKDLMTEFGDLKQRTVTEKVFQSQIEGLEDGFYVAVNYNSQYTNTSNHKEYILLKQNDKSKWEIFDYSYEFETTHTKTP